MILKRLKLETNWQDSTNCYIIVDEDTKETMVIDPASECEKIEEMLNTLEAKLKYIVLTHCHGDHTGAVNQLKKDMGGIVLIHTLDAEGLNNPNINMTDYIGMKQEYIEIDSRLNDNDLLHLGDMEFRVIHTPGHTIGGICLYCEEQKLLFSGDTLFRRTWGRTDLPTSSFADIINSISNKLMILPEDTIVYPGHGKSTMIHEEEPIYLDLKQGRD